MVFKPTFPDSKPDPRYKDLLSEFLWHKLDVYKGKVLFVDDTSQRQWTGASIKRTAIRVASYLIQVVELKPLDSCVLFYEHSDEILVIALGILFAGGVICAGAHEDPAEEHRYMIDVMKPKLVFADNSIRDELVAIRAAKRELDFKICIVDAGGANGSTEGNNTIFGYQEHLLKFTEGQRRFEENNVAQQLPVHMEPEDPTFVLLTSGSTGRPKPVARSQRNSIYTCHALDGQAASLWDLNEDTVMAGHLPLDHGTGIFNLKLTIAKGFRLIIMSGYELERMLAAIERYQITDCMLGSGYLHNLMSAPDELLGRYELSSLRNFIAVGSRVSSHELANKFMERFKDLSVRQMLGMTECGLASVVPRQDARSDTGSAGLLVPNVTVKLLDQNTGAEIEQFEQPGELLVAGPMVAKGYYGSGLEAQSRQAFGEDGFYRTHDICFMSANNKLSILGRDSEVLCVSDGWKVLPQEIEAALMAHPGIQEAAVLGVPHPELPSCDAPRAYVVPKEAWRAGRLTELGVARFAADRLSEPKHLVGGVKLMEDLPRLSVGKVDKKRLRAMDQQH